MYIEICIISVCLNVVEVILKSNILFILHMYSYMNYTKHKKKEKQIKQRIDLIFFYYYFL